MDKRRHATRVTIGPGCTFRGRLSAAVDHVVMTLALSVLLSAPAFGWFGEYRPRLQVVEPFVDMRSGPGRGYPIFHVAGEGDEVLVLKRRTDWFKIESQDGKQGWVHRDQMRTSLGLAAEPGDGSRQRRWEFGLTGGDFDGARSLSGYLGFSLTNNIGLQLEVTRVLGDYSEGVMGSAGIYMSPFPEWRVSPFLTIGTGIMEIRPQTTLVLAEDRTDEVAHVGVGADMRLSGKFMLRLEYKRHTVLTSRDDNEEIDQWKAGVSVLF